MNNLVSQQSPQGFNHYRPDIDGLRAIAVLLVVGFHAFPEWVTGGFIGVDIFFVISGFLITGIINNSQGSGTFRYTGFYARRIRRIFPALIVVLLAIALFGYLALLPDERIYLGIQIVSGAVFITNFTLLNSMGYFAPSIDSLPLMHLWSLGIEEQFYIFWPLLLSLSFRWKKSISLVMIVALLSFAANLVSVYDNSIAGFYAPWCRVWEMAAGGLLAFRKPQSAFSDKRWDNTYAIAGTILLLIAVQLINRDKYFPGFWALLPVVGAVFLIRAGTETCLNRWLANRWLVSIGLISYPLYLWHWPLLSFARILEEATPTPIIRIIAVLLSFVLAWATYQLVEKPVKAMPRSRSVIAVLCALLISELLLGLWLAKPQALSEADRLGNWEFEEDWVGWHKCNKGWDCRIIDPTRPVDVMVIGDSHAGHLGTGLADVFRESGANISVKHRSMCLPFFSMQTADKKYFECAGEFINRALEDAIASPSVKTIVLSGYANNFIYKYPDGVPENSNLRDLSHDESKTPNPGHVAVFRQGLDATLERLSQSGKRIVFLVDNPELDFDPRECVSHRPITLPGHRLRTPCAVSKTAYESRSAEYNHIVEGAQKKFPLVVFMHADAALCDQEWCWAMVNNDQLYSDRSHLTPAGSRYVLTRMKEKLLAGF